MNTTTQPSDQQQMLKFAANSLISDLLNNNTSFANKLEVAKLCVSDKELLQKCIESEKFLNSIGMQNTSPQKDLMLDFIKSCTKGDAKCSELMIEKITSTRGASLSATCNLFEELSLQCEICDDTVLKNFLVNYLNVNLQEHVSRRSFNSDTQDFQRIVSLVHSCFTEKNIFTFLSSDPVNKLLCEIDRLQKNKPQQNIPAIYKCLQKFENNEINTSTLNNFAKELATISSISQDAQLLLLQSYSALTIDNDSQELVNKVIYQHPYCQEIAKILKITSHKDLDIHQIGKITRSKNLMTCTEVQKHLKTNEEFALQILKKIEYDYRNKDRLDYSELRMLDTVIVEFINTIISSTHSSPALTLGLISLSGDEKVIESVLLWKKSLEEKKLIDSCLLTPQVEQIPNQFKL